MVTVFVEIAKTRGEAGLGGRNLGSVLDTSPSQTHVEMSRE
jgi:hypothetical protein